MAQPARWDRGRARRGEGIARSGRDIDGIVGHARAGRRQQGAAGVRRVNSNVVPFVPAGFVHACIVPDDACPFSSLLPVTA